MWLSGREIKSEKGGETRNEASAKIMSRGIPFDVPLQGSGIVVIATHALTAFAVGSLKHLVCNCSELTWLRERRWQTSEHETLSGRDFNKSTMCTERKEKYIQYIYIFFTLVSSCEGTWMCRHESNVKIRTGEIKLAQVAESRAIKKYHEYSVECAQLLPPLHHTLLSSADNETECNGKLTGKSRRKSVKIKIAY